VGNWAKQYGGGLHCAGTFLLIEHCLIANNTSGDIGGGICGYYVLGHVRGSRIIGNRAAMYGGGIFGYQAAPKLSGNVIADNWAGEYGGGMDFEWYSSPKLVNNTIVGNACDWGGGGMSFLTGCSPLLVNNVIVGNSSQRGGGLIVYASPSAFVTNSTMADNHADQGCALACGANGGGSPSTVTMANCILWDGGSEIFNGDGSTIRITYSDMSDRWAGAGNFVADPRFVDPPDGNFHLSPTSPCIEVGDDAMLELAADLLGLPVDELTDMDGEKRLFGWLKRPGQIPIVDIGADEFHPKPLGPGPGGG